MGVPLDTSIFLEIIIEPLDLDSSQFLQLNAAYTRDDVVVDVVQVVILGLVPEPGFRIDLVPRFNPCRHGVISGVADIQLLALISNGRRQSYQFIII